MALNAWPFRWWAWIARIRIFHGILDDYVEIAPCRAYVERLKQTAKHIQMTEYPDSRS
jgi:hypothetical protein